MATVKDILTRKGSQVFSIGKDATVLEGARLMNEYKIGCLVVIDHERVSGIFTERDVLSRVVAGHRNPVTTRVHEVMTCEMVCCQPDTDLEEARSVFKNRRIRHLPVVDEGQGLLGLVSIGDLNAYDADAKECTIHLLQEYIYGRA
ncbi:MAG: CBS domain-containing protein [Planctomycetota bacterium]|nr:CBS domain-containing protein [Planctomycetota bacterium]